MEPKGECSLAVTQILHLHLYKNRLSGEPLWLPHPLFLSFPLLSLSLSLLLSFHVCCGFGRCHFRHVFCAPRTLRVLIVGHPWGGGGERWGGPVWEQPCQVLWYDSAWSCRHLVCLKGKRKEDLASSLRFSSCPPFAFSSTSLPPYFHTPSFFFLSPLSWSSRWKQLLVQPARRLPTFSAQPYPINHGSELAARLRGSKRTRRGDFSNFLAP